ncbi:type IV pilus biogenesis protein PilM [Pseudomonas aeruginosa]|nr:type IV pilus biogenesis protein PilM [Pseudomonas aeruginosa]ELM7196630.1 type IV pilus biogenesis protein PilM [Pseudomonas aeruginosa]
MPLLWIALLLALLTGTWLSVQSDHATSSAELAEIDTLARSLLLYRSSLAEYAHANPGFTGLPADSALGLPAWFRKPARLQGYIAAGTSYAFIASPSAGLAAAVDAGTESDLVGVRRNGQLVTRRLGATAIVLPAPIPEGAVVAVK